MVSARLLLGVFGGTAGLACLRKTGIEVIILRRCTIFFDDLILSNRFFTCLVGSSCVVARLSSIPMSVYGVSTFSMCCRIAGWKRSDRHYGRTSIGRCHNLFPLHLTSLEFIFHHVSYDLRAGMKINHTTRYKSAAEDLTFPSY